MGRRNHAQRKPQARRRADGETFRSRPQAPPVEKLIIPRGRCFSGSRRGKMIFTKADAERALKQVKTDRVRLRSAYVEKRAYECPPGGCGGWHLTSQETYTPRARGTRT